MRRVLMEAEEGSCPMTALAEARRIAIGDTEALEEFQRPDCATERFRAVREQLSD